MKKKKNTYNFEDSNTRVIYNSRIFYPVFFWNLKFRLRPHLNLCIISQRWNAKACRGNKDINETERITKEKYKRVNGIFSLQVSLTSKEKYVFRLLFSFFHLFSSTNLTGNPSNQNQSMHLYVMIPFSLNRSIDLYKMVRYFKIDIHNFIVLAMNSKYNYF